MIQPKKQRRRNRDASLPPVTTSPRKGSKSYDRSYPNMFPMPRLALAPLVLPSAPVSTSAQPVPRTKSPSSVVDVGTNSSDDDDCESVQTESTAPAKKLVRKVRRVRVPANTTSTSAASTSIPMSTIPTPPTLLTPSIPLPCSAAVRKDLDALMQFAAVRQDLDALMQRKQQEAEVREVHKQVEVEVRQALAPKEEPPVSASPEPDVQERRVSKLGGVPIESESATTSNGTSARTNRRPSTSQQRRPSTTSQQRRPSTTTQQRRPSTTTQQRRPSTTTQQRRPSTTSQQRRSRKNIDMTADYLASTAQTSTNNADGKAAATQISVDTADEKAPVSTSNASNQTAADAADVVSLSSLVAAGSNGDSVSGATERTSPGRKKTRKFLTRRGSFESTCTSTTSKKEKSTTSTAASSSPSSSAKSSHIIAYISSRFRGHHI
jgi:hypothetical protein